MVKTTSIPTFLLVLMHSVLLRVASQNLVQNPSFEDHLPVEFIEPGTHDAQFSNMMKHWRSLNSHTFICDCQHQRTPDEIRSRMCRFDKLKPHSGCTMMELSYMPNCPNYALATRGCSAYLAHKLEAPLEIGEVYEVSFWLNVQPPDEPNYLKHIGFALYPDIVRRLPNSMLDGSEFLVDSVKIGEWRQVKWFVRPTCRLQVLVIGVFRGPNGPPVQNNGLYDDVFYVDDVAIRKLKKEEPKEAAIVPHCHYKAKELPLGYEIAGITCYFETGSSSLTSAARTVLDSFGMQAREEPKTVFIITGHTDNLGENHIELSNARLDSVLNYLQVKNRTSRYRFARYAMGASEPANSKATEEGRRDNRRVTISQIELAPDNVLYRYVLAAHFAGDSEQAYSLLSRWVELAPRRNAMLAFNDPRLAGLFSKARPRDICFPAKGKYPEFKEMRLAFILDSLWAEDQKARTLPYYIENLNSYFAKMDSSDHRFDVDFAEDSLQIAQRDERNFAALQQLLAKHGWPKTSEVGERAASAAFLIINHQSDTAVYASYLPILEENCMNGEADWAHYAMMYDRLQVLKGLPQRYGTQFHTAAPHEMYPLEDPAKVNECRERIGLKPIPLKD